MVKEQLRPRGVTDERVLAAMSDVPREEFVPESVRDLAYEDGALAIGCEQTISQPLVVATITQALELRGSERVLEVGGGSGYQAAVLARLAREVLAVELEPELAERSRAILHRLGVRNVEVVVGDGKRGWPAGAPYDAIVVSCAAETVPRALLDQLSAGGRMVLPVGPAGGLQTVILVDADGTERDLFPARFVPLR